MPELRLLLLIIGCLAASVAQAQVPGANGGLIFIRNAVKALT